MENIPALLQDLKNYLIHTFEEVYKWFDSDAQLLTFVPENKGWTVAQILEHIALTNHFLLILIEKGCRKALNKHQNEPELLAQLLPAYTFRKDALTEIGLYDSFTWIRPEHMEPKGETLAVKALLGVQLQKCLDMLALLPNGEGILYQTTMTVHNLGKIDVYEYIYFLGQHAQRHIGQMQKNLACFYHT
jgi:DinB superfamily